MQQGWSHAKALRQEWLEAPRQKAENGGGARRGLPGGGGTEPLPCPGLVPASLLAPLGTPPAWLSPSLPRAAL